MNLPRYAVENPVVTGMIALAIIGMGFYAIATTPQELQPYLESPVVGIEISFPGMSAEDMATFFAEPIEKQVGVIKGVQNIRSTSQEGHTEIALVFPYGTDMKRALADTESLVNSFLNSIPQDKANATIPWVVHIDQNNPPIVDFALSRPGWDPVRLREFADNTLTDKFQQVPGVQSAIVWGGKRRQVQIIVDRTKLAAYGLSILDVQKHVDAFSVSRAAGRITNSHGDWLLRVNDMVTDRDLRALENVPVGQTRDAVVYLRDVATVKDTIAEERSAYHFNGKPYVLLSIVKTPEVGAPAVIAGAQKLAKEFEATYPSLRMRVAYNQNDYISLIIHNSTKELVLTLLITSLVVLLFLRDLRSTFVVFVTLPLSILFGLFFFRPVGLTINTPTTTGFIFVMGRLVDDSVILLDVIHRHLKLGKSPKQAAIDGADEVMTALISTSLSFWATLIPLLFLGGALGTGFRGLTSAMLLANIGSTLLALSLNPMMAAYLFKPAADRRVGPLQRVVNWLCVPVEWVLGRLERGYHHILRLSIDYRFVAVTLAVISVLLAVEIYKHLPQELVPPEDTGIGVGQVIAWPGTALPEVDRITSRVERIILGLRDTDGKPVVEKVSTTIGQEPVLATYFTGYGLPTMQTANFKITFVDIEHRHKSIWQLQNEIVAQAHREVPGIRHIWFKEMGATPVASARAEVQANVQGPSLQGVYALGQRLEKVANEVPGPTMIYSNFCLCEPQLRIVVDRTRAAELGLPTLAIAAQAYYALQGGMTEQFFHPANAWLQSRMLVRYADQERTSPEDVGQTMIALPDGRQVPLKSVARVEWANGADYIVRENQQYEYTVFAGYGALGLKQTMLNVVMAGRLQLAPLPQGYTITPSGLMPEMLDALARLNLGLKASLAIMFLYLVLQYRSVPMALVMMTAIPLEAIGAMVFLYVRHLHFSALVLWGLIVLLGIVLSNAILLIDRAMHNERRGMAPREAILEAGPTRLRPILMTALATMAAWVPYMFWPPTGAQKFVPITTGMVGGLVGNIFMTLVIVPAVYVITHDMLAFFRHVYGGAPSAAQATTLGEAGRVAAARPGMPTPAGRSGDGPGGGAEEA